MCVKIISNYEYVSFGSDIMKYSFKHKSVAEGIDFCSIEAQGFKTACVSISFLVPLSEDASLYALIPNILTHSSANYPDITAIEKKLAFLYGADIIVDISKIGEHQELKIVISSIDDRFAIDGERISEECSRLLFELVFNPRLENGVFVQADVESEKRLLAERLASEINDKRLYAKNRCEEIMCADEAFGIHRYGTAESIAKITPQTLYDAYKEMLRMAHITIGVSGGSFESVAAVADEYLSGISRNYLKTDTVIVESACDVQRVTEKESVKQGKLVLGFRMGMKDANDNYAARRIMVDLFGGSPHSKLFTVVREKMSLCYYCSARMLRQKGLMYVQSGIETYNAQKAEEAILAQLEAIKNGDFTDEDIEFSVKALEDGFKSVTDSPEALDAWFTAQSLSGEYLYPDDYIEAFKKVTREDIIKAASEVTLDTVFMLEGTLEGGEETCGE